MLADKRQIAALIPHSGSMCLLDGVLACDTQRIVCTSNSHRDAHNPLRIGDSLPALCGIEYAAQAMAVHGGMTAVTHERPRAGYLVAVRDVVCSVPRLDTLASALTIAAERQMGDGTNVMYEFSLNAEGTIILKGRATVLLDVRPAA